MSYFKLFTDSSSDLSEQCYVENEIVTIPFYSTFDKKNYVKERVDITVEDFYKKLRSENVFPSTSQPNVSDYESAFRPALEKGNDIVCVCLSSKLSGSYQSAVTATNILVEEFPDRKLAVIDSAMASTGQGLVLNEVVRMRKNNVPFDQIIDNINKQKTDMMFFMTVDSLEYLQKGGRIGKATALAGGLMKIKPIISITEGALVPTGNIRGRSKAMQKILDMVLEKVSEHKKEYSYSVMHADCINEAEELRKMLESHGISSDLPITGAGVTIGSHTGPTMIGLSAIRKYETL